MSASAISIGRLTVDDLPEILALEKLCFKDPWVADNFLGELRRSVTVPLGLKENGRLVAQCFFWLLPPEIHLLNVGVLPERRGRGLARRLMTAMLALGRKAGVKEILLEVRPSNRAAVALYESVGFTRVGVRPDYYDDGEEAWLMTMVLPPAEN